MFYNPNPDGIASAIGNPVADELRAERDKILDELGRVLAERDEALHRIDELEDK